MGICHGETSVHGNTQTQIFKAILGAAEVCGAQCWGTRNSEGRKVEFSSEN